MIHIHPMGKGRGVAKKAEPKNKKAAPSKKKIEVQTNLGSHREKSEGTLAPAPENPVIVTGEDAVVVETVVMHRSLKKEKRPHFMADIKI